MSKSYCSLKKLQLSQLCFTNRRQQRHTSTHHRFSLRSETNSGRIIFLKLSLNHFTLSVVVFGSGAGAAGGRVTGTEWLGGLQLSSEDELTQFQSSANTGQVF